MLLDKVLPCFLTDDITLRHLDQASSLHINDIIIGNNLVWQLLLPTS